MRISDAAELWLGELERNGLKHDTTIYTYRKILDRLADRYDPRDVDEISLTMLRKFLDEEATNRKAFRERGEVVRVGPSRVGQQVSTLKGFFYWLWDEGYIPDDPGHKLRRPKQQKPEEYDGIVSVSAQDVQRLLAAAHGWPERICLNVLIYTGARRRAVANLRLSDYDTTAVPPTLTFREKGGKTITKPVARPLAQLLDEAFMAGVWEGAGEDPWLIPPRNVQGHPATEAYQKHRSDTIVYRIVKAVAARAGVDCHVHSLRGAFAVQFLEQHPDRLVALQALMGHTQMETTRVYLRRLDRRREMEAVVDLDWGAFPSRLPDGRSGEMPTAAGAELTDMSTVGTGSPRSPKKPFPSRIRQREQAKERARLVREVHARFVAEPERQEPSVPASEHVATLRDILAAGLEDSQPPIAPVQGVEPSESHRGGSDG